jgi:MATE family multidrug resistance protein
MSSTFIAEPRAAKLVPELRSTVALALPLIAGQLSTMGQNTVDVMLAGHLGAQVLGAVSIGTAVWSLALMAAVGVMMALPPVVAQLDGGRRRHEVGPLFRQAVYLAAGLGVLLMLAVRYGGPLLVDAIGVDAGMRQDVNAFLRAISFGAPAISLYFAARGLSEGLSMPGPSMMFGLLGLLVLAPVGYALMYGRLGAPSLGARGSGIAAALVCWVQMGAFTLWLRFSGNYRNLGWSAGRRAMDPAAVGGLLRIGLPMAVSVLLEVSLFSACGLAIGRFGAAASASHQVALNVAAFAFMVPLGLAMAITVRVGNAVGRGDAAGVRRAGLAGIGLTLGTQSVSSILMLGVPGVIAGLFTNDAVVAAGAVTLLRFAAIFQVSDGVQVASAGALRGLKDTRVPMVITAIAYWAMGMPIGFILAFGQGMRTPGLWVGMIAALSIAAALLFGRFLTLSRQLVLAR